MSSHKKTTSGQLHFPDYPEFTPNLTPSEIFRLGSFGGTYWRDIHSKVTGKNYTGKHKEFPESWWEGIPEDNLTRDMSDYSAEINKYGVRVGSSLEYWEEHGWIHAQDPYGWVQWYCRFYAGRRTADDSRQIKRWLGLAGPRGRFRLALERKIREAKAKRAKNISEVSPKVRQTLQHWAVKL